MKHQVVKVADLVFEECFTGVLEVVIKAAITHIKDETMWC